MALSRSYGPRPISMFLVLVLVLSISWLAEAKAEMMLKIDQAYTGRVNVESLDPQTLNVTTDDAPRVIASQEAYEAFIRRIPKEEISKTRQKSSSPSKDPLLARPKIDFAKQVMVVVINRHDMYQPIKIRAIISEAKRTVVRLAGIPKPEDMAQPIGMGAYTAVVFAKPATPIEVE